MLAPDDYIPLLVSIAFLALSGFKFWGYARGIEGGARKPTLQRLCGT